jgi:glycosyltransferase involved in cell wall biosynthesis
VRVALSNASRAWGGVHLVTEVLARGLQERGHEVRVLCRAGSRLEARMRGIAPLDPVLRGMDLHPGSLWATGRALRRFRPDVLLTLTTKDVRLSAPVARALGIPVVVRHANDRPIRPGPYGRMLYGALPAHHVTNAEATRRTVLASAPWLPPERVRVIYNGVHIERFETAQPAPLDLPAGAVALGYVGSFEPRKGLLDLAAAWPAVAAAVPAAHLLLVGEGSQEERLRALLADSPRVRFLGYRADTPAVMRALDALVLPSHREGAPNVVLEAMAAGRPVVATDVSGTAELMLEGITGLLVPPRAPEALARALVALASDGALRDRMAAAAHEHARSRFSLTRMLDEYEAFLGEVARGG